MRQYRSSSVIGIGALGFAVALAIGACETTRNPGGIQRDVTQPNIDLSTAAGDTQDIAGGLRFNVSAIDNLAQATRSEEHTSELQSHSDLVCRLLLEKKKKKKKER